MKLQNVPESTKEELKSATWAAEDRRNATGVPEFFIPDDENARPSSSHTFGRVKITDEDRKNAIGSP